MDHLQGEAPPGYDSVYGQADSSGPLNYDEMVVYKEEAILPFAVVEYRFMKHRCLQDGAISECLGHHVQSTVDALS